VFGKRWASNHDQPETFTAKAQRTQSFAKEIKLWLFLSDIDLAHPMSEGKDHNALLLCDLCAFAPLR
jgi:hypothetical protein